MSIIFGEDKKVVLVLGAGGVGKTTTSIAMAFAALEQGKKKIGLLSIDPAKRLADALGIPLGTKPALVPIKTKNYLGQIHAAMVDQKEIFDQMVKRYAPTPLIANKILGHPIYQAASTELAGPLEYMALAQLESMVASKSFDLIIVDTPPDSHALDFLSRPNILADFMENKVMSWLIKPFHMASKIGIGRLLNHGERLMGGLSKVTGLQALKLVAEFLILMQQVIEGFHENGQRIKSLLSDPGTFFFLVSTPNQTSFDTAQFLKRELAAKNYPLYGWVFNRTIGSELKKSIAAYKNLVEKNEISQDIGMDSFVLRSDLEDRLLFELKKEGIENITLVEELHDTIASEEAIWKLATYL